MQSLMAISFGSYLPNIIVIIIIITIIHSNITDIENEVCVFQSCIYDYFKINDKSKDPDHTRNSLFSEYNDLSRRQLKNFLKDFKRNTDADNSIKIRYVNKLIRIKRSKKGSRLRTEMTNDEKIEKDF